MRTAAIAVAAAVLAVTILACLTPGRAAALTRAPGLDELTRRAATIVVAETTAARSFRSADPRPSAGYRGGILTDVHLRVSRVLKGSATRRLVLTVPGGTLGRETIESPDAPAFVPGGAYVVFLDRQGDIIAWRHGQPQIRSGQVPALGRSLATTMARIARLTGRRATVLGPLPAAAKSGAGGRQRDAESALPSAADAADAAGVPGRAARDDLPVIVSVTPDPAAAGTGTIVTISGSGFGDAGGSVGFFYQDDAPLIEAPIVSWSPTTIRCRVPTDIIDGYPASAGSGPVYVVRSDGTLSNGHPFTVTFGYGGVQWPRNRCPYKIEYGGGAAFKAAIDAAAQTWTAAAGGRFRFIDRGRVQRRTTRPGDDRNTIGWAADLPSDVVASAWRTSIGGALVETDLVFNAAYDWSAENDPDAMDVQTVALHELGHWLSLRDLYGAADTAKVMYGFSADGEVKRVLAADDIAGARWIYSPARRDRTRPRTLARREKVRRGRTVRLSFRVRDARYSCGAARIRIVVRDARGRRVAVITGGMAPTNTWTDLPYRRVRLPRGTYRWYVYATDLAGNKQVRVGSNRLIVR
jgi:hypothetical protein